MKQKYRDLLIFTIVMFFTVILELALNQLQVKEENIYLVFVLSILIIIIESKSIVYGLMASLVTVLSFNFFITEPKLTFVVNDPNYYVSFVMFIVVTFMVNSLVIQLQKQIRLSRENEKQINVLYNISTDVLHANSNEEIYGDVVDRIKEQEECEISILTLSDEVYGCPIDIDTYAEARGYCIDNNEIVDGDNPLFAGLKGTLFPIVSVNNNYGVLILFKEDKDEKDIVFIQNVIEEIVVALDRNDIAVQQEQSKVQIEKEKFKTALLRGLSHDLKTPLTMIQSGSDFLYESYETIPEDSKKELIKDIYDESCNLSHFVNNLLDMTKLENKDVKLNRKLESAEDIIYEVLDKMKKRLENINVQVNNPEELVMVYADTDLLSQVFYNIIDNAITHTKDGTDIYISYYKEDDQVRFEIADNGGGISAEKLNEIFDDFYSFSVDQDKKRNHGLGLSICKGIIEAHGGTISAVNNDMGGMTFTFSVKDREENNG